MVWAGVVVQVVTGRVGRGLIESKVCVPMARGMVGVCSHDMTFAVGSPSKFRFLRFSKVQVDLFLLRSFRFLVLGIYPGPLVCPLSTYHVRRPNLCVVC